MPQLHRDIGRIDRRRRTLRRHRSRLTAGPISRAAANHAAGAERRLLCRPAGPALRERRRRRNRCAWSARDAHRRSSGTNAEARSVTTASSRDQIARWAWRGDRPFWSLLGRAPTGIGGRGRERPADDVRHGRRSRNPRFGGRGGILRDPGRVSTRHRSRTQIPRRRGLEPDQHGCCRGPPRGRRPLPQPDRVSTTQPQPSSRHAGLPLALGGGGRGSGTEAPRCAGPRGLS